MATARGRGRGDADVADGRQSSDAYVGMLLVSLVAMIAGCVLLFLDFSQYPESKAPSPPNLGAPQRSAPPTPEAAPQAQPDAQNPAGQPGNVPAPGTNPAETPMPKGPM